MRSASRSLGPTMHTAARARVEVRIASPYPLLSSWSRPRRYGWYDIESMEMPNFTQPGFLLVMVPFGVVAKCVYLTSYYAESPCIVSFSNSSGKHFARDNSFPGPRHVENSHLQGKCGMFPPPCQSRTGEAFQCQNARAMSTVVSKSILG